MKVYDILVESKKADQVDEGPVRFLKRTLGKNTGMGKAAQLDVELDKEVKSVFQDYFAVSKQDPKQKGLTAKGLANFLVAKGFISKPSAVMAYINQDPGMMRSLKKTTKKVGKGLKSAGAKVTGAASNLKQKLAPKDTGLTPPGAQGNLDLAGGKMNQSMYSESQLMEVDMQLSKGQAMKVIKRFVQQGFQANLAKSGAVKKSAYGDAPDPADAPKAKASKQSDVDKALDIVKNAGYTISGKPALLKK